jgi:Rho GDP-dissociation inhibitor
MIGSYGPAPTPYTKRFVSEEAPSGMIARSGTYAVQSRGNVTSLDARVFLLNMSCPLVIDDDGNVWADFSCTSL